MRISAKGRYALAAVISMAQQHHNGEFITLISIADKLGISKIYLEQVFSLLKRGGIVNSIKGAQGGYQLSRIPRQITALDVLISVETALFDKTEDTVPEKAPEIEYAMRSGAFDLLDGTVADTLNQVTIEDLANAAERHRSDGAVMFYI